MRAGFEPRRLLAPIVIMLTFCALAIVGYSAGRLFYLFNFGYIGTSIGVGMGLYAVLRRPPSEIIAHSANTSVRSSCL